MSRFLALMAEAVVLGLLALLVMPTGSVSARNQLELSQPVDQAAVDSDATPGASDEPLDRHGARRAVFPALTMVRRGDRSA